MRSIRGLLITMLLLIASSFYLIQLSIDKNKTTNLIVDELPNFPLIKPFEQSKPFNDLFHGNMFDLMDKTIDELEDDLQRKADDVLLSAYGYEWHVYDNDENNYVQVGVDDGIVKTVFATGNELSSEPFTIGTPYEEIEELFPFKDSITYEEGASFYTFILNDSEIQSHPLIKISDDLFIQCYFDTHTEELSSVRLITGEILLRQRFYEMEYRGNLPEEPSYSDEEWEEINKGMEQQIFSISNIYRNRFELKPLIYDENVSDVALLHSKDMVEQQYFSHERPDGTGLKERLSNGDILYLMAGENIAAYHTDAPAAVEGWLNSEGHREALLHKEYTHIGVGVYEFHYTQNFIKKF